MQSVNGLNNLGNTCYLNTTLQCLFRCDDFVKMILRENPRPKGKVPPTVTLKNLVLQMNVSKVSSPHEFLHLIETHARQTKHPQFQTLRRQHDMSEFLLYLLDYIHTETERCVKINIGGEAKNETEKQMIESMVQFKGFFSKHYSDLIPLFFGQFQSSIHKIKSNEFSYNYDPFVTIQLDIPPPSRKKFHLYDCLNHFSETEAIETSETTLHKNIRLWKLPQYLIIVLKRFSFTGRKRNEKILNNIKDNTVFVLMSRAAIINFDDFYKFLRKRKVFAAIDVFPIEPVPKNHKIRKLTNVIFSPHRAGALDSCLLYTSPSPRD